MILEWLQEMEMWPTTASTEGPPPLFTRIQLKKLFSPQERSSLLFLLQKPDLNKWIFNKNILFQLCNFKSVPDMNPG